MKLRLHGDSVRLRLSEGDVARFASTGRVAETVRLAGRPLTYALAAADVDALHAAFDGDTLTVSVPRALAESWATTEQVGLAAVQSSEDRRLGVLVEKDAGCFHEQDAGAEHRADAE